MRLVLGITIAAAATTFLAGCQSEEQMKAAYRAQFVEACTSAGSRQAVPGLNVGTYCNCVADQIISNRSAAELSAMGNDAMASPATQQAITQCVTQQMSEMTNAAQSQAQQMANGAAAEGADEAN